MYIQSSSSPQASRWIGEISGPTGARDHRHHLAEAHLRDRGPETEGYAQLCARVNLREPHVAVPVYGHQGCSAAGGQMIN